MALKKPLQWTRKGACIVVTSHQPSSSGYFNVHVGGRRQALHRVICERRHGKPAPRQDTLHSCDNRSCINPDHLSFGSRKDNMQDAVSKDRSSRGTRRYSAKLTDAQVLEIRNSTGSQESVAERYSVSRTVIGRIRRGTGWKHVYARK